MTRRRDEPPRLSTRILAWSVPQDDAGASIVGDLHEEWTERRNTNGHDSADAWYRREAIAVALSAIKLRISASVRGRARNRARHGVQSNQIMDTLAQDFRFAWRMLHTRRTLTLVAVTTIALGVGAATAIFSVVDSVLLRPLPYRESSKLVNLWRTFPDWRKDPVLASGWDHLSFTMNEGLEFGRISQTLDGVGFWRTSVSVRADGEARDEVAVSHASASLLPLLGVNAEIGRTFLPGEDGPNAQRVALISHDLWVAQFGGTAGVLGRAIRLDSSTFRIVGVLPAGFRLAGERATRPVSVWVPAGVESFELADNNRMFDAIGRLKLGRSPSQVQTELEQFFTSRWTHSDPTSARVEESQAEITAPIRKPLVLMMSAAALLLLMTCGNVATLLLGEASRREPEIATRLSIGAGRSRVAGQLFTEHLVLAFAGSIAGVVVAWIATHVLIALAPRSLPRLNEIGLNYRGLAFACAISIATALIFGFAPIISLLGSASTSLVRAPGTRASSRRSRFERLGLSVQIALSITLLVGAALLGRTLQRLGEADLGFRPNGVLYVRPNVPAVRYPDAARRVAFARRLADELRSIPGVTAVSVGNGVPFGDGRSGTSIESERAGGVRFAADAQARAYDATMLSTLGIALLDGRNIMPSDNANAPKVLLVNETMARRFWPDQPAVGRRAMIDGQWREVVGVVHDVKFLRADETLMSTFYLPVDQGRNWTLSLALKVDDNASLVIPTVRDRLHRLDPTVALSSIEPLTMLISRSVAEFRFRALVVGFFAVVAFILGVVGAYGVAAGTVNRRLREMGIRMALGATSASVMRLIVRSVALLAAIGALAGTLASLLGSRALAPFLYGITPTDGVTYVGVIVALLSGVVVACLVPAMRVSRVEPATVLRSE